MTGEGRDPNDDGGALAAPRRPGWFRLLSFLMLVVAAHLGFEGLAALQSATSVPSDKGVVLSEAEARLRAYQTTSAIMKRDHAAWVRVHAGLQVTMAAAWLFAVAALFTRDPRGRRLTMGAAWLFILYEGLHTAFALLVERPALLVAMPRLAEELARIGEMKPGEVDIVAQGMRLGTLVTPLVFLFLGVAFSIVLLVFFGGRRGRMLYGLSVSPRRRS